MRRLDNYDGSVLHIYSRDVLPRGSHQDNSWEVMLPHEVAVQRHEKTASPLPLLPMAGSLSSLWTHAGASIASKETSR